MTTLEAVDTASPGRFPLGSRTVHRAIPLRRIVTTELRKMFDTRAGFWLMASIGIMAALATSAVVLFAPNQEFNYSSFAAAIGIPTTIVLPLIAILSVTDEWSQRSGLTTFTLVPARGRVLMGKAIARLTTAAVSVPIAFGVGGLGNFLGTAIAGVDPVWDLTVPNLLTIGLAHVLALLFGFMSEGSGSGGRPSAARSLISSEMRCTRSDRSTTRSLQGIETTWYPLLALLGSYAKIPAPSR